jgi:leader peptidase (prepilin peptidase) / N-methyltransferase
MSSLDVPAPTASTRSLGTARTVTTVLAAAVALACLVRHGLGIDVLFGSAFVAALAVISVVDWEERRVPNRLVLPASALTAAAVFVLHGDEFTVSVLAGIGAFLFFFVPALVTRTVGMGDAKLALLVGLGLGADALLGLFVTSFAAGGVALVLILKRGSQARKEGLPFAPFLAVGAAVALIVGGGSLYA